MLFFFSFFSFFIAKNFQIGLHKYFFYYLLIVYDNFCLFLY